MKVRVYYEKMTNIPIEDVNLNEPYADITPLEQAVGFRVSEQTYDLLDVREQLVIDLLCAGWTQADIGFLFGASQPAIAACVRRIRFKLAETTLKLVLTARMHYREINGGPSIKRTRPIIFSND